jgi:hypothetical protein
LHPSSQTPFRSFEEITRERERERSSNVTTTIITLHSNSHTHPIPLLLIYVCNPLVCIHSKGKQEGRGTKKQRKKKLGVLTDILLHWATRRRRRRSRRRRRRRRQQQQGFFLPSVCFLLLPKGSGFESKIVPVSVLGS